MAKIKKSKKPEDAKQPTFEAALEKLEVIVEQLEDGRLGLSESLQKYEEGVKCLNQCHQLLQKAERKIELLSGVDAEGAPIVEPFDDDALSLEEKARARSRRRSRGAKDSGRSGSEADVDEQPGLF